jgi:tetratricopeptide (TPR) repeat protein
MTLFQQTHRFASANHLAKIAIALAVLLSSIAAGMSSPSMALKEYRSGNFTNALAEYTKIAAVKTNDLRLVFNAGDAAYGATNFDLAQKLFQQVTLSPDLKLQQKAFYNLGNTQFQQAKAAKDLDGLEKGLETAAKTFERAVTLDKTDADAAFNLAFTKDAVEQIKRLKEAMRLAKSDADAAVRQKNYHHAVEIMESLAKIQIAAKQFEDFTKKLKDIDAIVTPHQP